MNTSTTAVAAFFNSTSQDNHHQEHTTKLPWIVKAINSYIPLMIIFIGVVGNTSAFLVFRFNKDMKKLSTMVIFSFLTVIDTSSLFMWNLNHFLEPNFKIYIENLSLFTCKFFTFLQFFSLQSSGWLLSYACVDRYFSIMSTPGSFISKLPFGTIKSSVCGSALIVSIMALANSHMIILNGWVRPPKQHKRVVEFNVTMSKQNMSVLEGILAGKSNESYWYTLVSLNHSHLQAIGNYTLTNIEYFSFECYRYSEDFKIVPLWDSVNMIVYSFVPFSIMAVFNVLLIKNTLSTSKTIKKNKQDKSTLNALKKKRRLTISLIVITCAFVVMTMPSTIMFGFFIRIIYYEIGKEILYLVDSIAFLNHSSIFFTCFLTNVKFRSIVLNRFSSWLGRSSQGPNSGSTKEQSVSKD
jgi:hypothetical protein